MPACLRPLTLDEEMAPPPPSQPARLLRAASHRLRKALHKKHMLRQRAEEERMQAELEAALHHETIPEGMHASQKSTGSDAIHTHVIW